MQLEQQMIAEALRFLTEKAGWWRQARVVFYREWQRRSGNSFSPSEKLLYLEAMLKEIQQIGSPLYQLLYATELDETAELDKIELLQEHLGVWLDRNDFLQLGRAAYPFASGLSPDSAFWREVARAMQQRYPNQEISQRADHQLRMYFDRHNLQYIRRHFAVADGSDWQAFKAYQRRFIWSEPAGNFGRKNLQESARLHNKYPKGATLADFYRRGLNEKRLSHHFHSEFIFDAEGNFVSQWNVLKETSLGSIQSDGEYYRQHYGPAYSGFALQVMNTESFNYAERNDYTADGKGRHNQLDASPVRLCEYRLRKELFRLFETPKQEYWSVKKAQLGQRKRRGRRARQSF